MTQCKTTSYFSQLKSFNLANFQFTHTCVDFNVGKGYYVILYTRVDVSCVVVLHQGFCTTVLR